MKKLISYKEAMERYSLCRNTVMKLAIDSGAKVKIGKSARVDMDQMDAYINSLKVNAPVNILSNEGEF